MSWINCFGAPKITGRICLAWFPSFGSSLVDKHTLNSIRPVFLLIRKLEVWRIQAHVCQKDWRYICNGDTKPKLVTCWTFKFQRYPISLGHPDSSIWQITSLCHDHGKSLRSDKHVAHAAWPCFAYVYSIPFNGFNLNCLEHQPQKTKALESRRLVSWCHHRE